MEPQNGSGTRRLRVGLVGCGKMGLQHLKVLAGMPGVQVVGIADPVQVGEDAGSLLPSDAIVTSDAESLFKNACPDVVHIVTPPSTHAKLVRSALSAGCHVFVEKPFTLHAAESAEVLAIAEERGLTACAGHQCLFEAPALGVAASLSEIGRLVYVESHFSFRMVRRTITPAEQCKDILPHAVYPLLQQLRAGSAIEGEPVVITGVNAEPSGDIFALLRVGGCTGVLAVTLSGRPVEQYQYLVGTNGSLRADFITGSVVRLLGPGAGFGVLFTPYRRAWQTIKGATRTFWRILLGRQTSYPGLYRLLSEFYSAIAAGKPSPVSPQSILETVDTCDKLGAALDLAVEQSEHRAEQQLRAAERSLPVPQSTGVVLVTGGTGMLGNPIAMELRTSGYRTRVVARRVPPPSRRIPGVEYLAGNVAEGLTDEVLDEVGLIVHCAAETAGGKAEHERNSIVASRMVVESAARAGVRRLIHISSLAVLEPSRKRGARLDENSPVDSGNQKRGPYVWGKAESELEVQRLAAKFGIALRVVRPGPLVDYRDFEPPGRLGREVGPWFVAIGSRKSTLSVCDVWTAARVIRSYVQDFEAAPPLVNLVEHPAPTRGELAKRLSESRVDLKFRWVPNFLVAAINGPARLAQRLVLKSNQPVDIRSAFSSEQYATGLAEQTISKAGPSSIRF